MIPLPLLSGRIAKASLLVILFNTNNFCIQYEITEHFELFNNISSEITYLSKSRKSKCGRELKEVT